MPVSNLGRIGFVIKGDWAEGEYKYLDVVRYNQSTWICAVPTTTEEPSVGSDWQNALTGPAVNGLSNWNQLSGAQSPPLIVYDDLKYWSLTTEVNNIALHKPAESPALFRDINDQIEDSAVSAEKTWSSNQQAQKGVIGAPDWPVSLTYDAEDNLVEALYVKGSDQFKQTLNYTLEGDLDTVVYEQSNDGGVTWVTLGAETLVYTAGTLTSTNWVGA